MNEIMPSSDNLSLAQRRKRLYMSYCFVFCAVLFFDISIFNALVYCRVSAIWIEVIKTGLRGIIRRIPQYHAYRLLVLQVHAHPVLGGQPAQLERALPLHRAARRTLPVHIVQRVHEHQVRELPVSPRLLPICIFDVQVGDVVRQYRNLVRVHLVQVLVLQPVSRQVLDEVRDERPRPCRRVQYLHVLVRKRAPEVLPQQPVPPPV